MCKFIIFILTLFCLFGCSEYDIENVYGTYAFKNADIDQKLLIKPDGTFEQTILVLKNKEFLRTNGTWWLEYFAKSTYISFKNYISVLDFKGKLKDNYPKYGSCDITTGGFSVINWFGSTEISFLEGYDYKKVKNWVKGDDFSK
jgi:hypothetical protein